MLTFTKYAAWVAAAAWIGMVVARGQFWDARADRLADPVTDSNAPDVHAVVPARNEGDVIARTTSSVIAQRYPGRLTLTVVDDRSEDNTALGSGGGRRASAGGGAGDGASCGAAARGVERQGLGDGGGRCGGAAGRCAAGVLVVYRCGCGACRRHARAVGGDGAARAARSRVADGGAALRGAVGAVADSRVRVFLPHALSVRMGERSAARDGRCGGRMRVAQR